MGSFRDRVRRLERHAPRPDRPGFMGADGLWLVRVLIPGEHLEVPPGVRAMTADEAGALGCVFVPGVDDRPEPEDFPDATA